MSIKYDKLFKLLDEKAITVYRLRKDKIIGGATLDKMRLGTGHIDTRSIESLSNYINCQPGDIMEYVEQQ
jgi:Predicted transcriptional regulator